MRHGVLNRLSTILLVGAFSCFADNLMAQTLVYENFAGGVNGNDGYSRSDDDGSRRHADCVTLNSTSQITTVRWSGIYTQGSDNIVATDNFVVAIYADDNGEPMAGNALAEFNVGNDVNRTDNGTTSNSGATEYTYSASIDFVMQAGVTYWVSIYNNTAGDDDDFFWSRLSGGNSHRTTNFSASWELNNPARSFDFSLFEQPVFDNTPASIDRHSGSDDSWPQIAAHSFTLPQNSQLKVVQWSGIYVGAEPAKDDFQIGIYADSAGVPSGAPLATFNVGNDVGRTTNGTIGGNTLFEYAAGINFAATGGTKYWISIHDQVLTGAPFCWVGEMGEGDYAFSQGSSGWILGNDTQLDFSLFGSDIGNAFAINATGNWDDAAAWSTGLLPNNLNPQTIIGTEGEPGAAISSTITLDSSATDAVINELRIGVSSEFPGDGGAMGQLNHSSGSLSTNGWSLVGGDATDVPNLGVYNLSGDAVLNSTNRLILGVGGGEVIPNANTGIVNVSENATLNADTLWVGYNDGNFGQVVQTGGNVNTYQWITIGTEPTGIGAYEISAGQLNVMSDWLTVGEAGSGSFEASGSADVRVTGSGVIVGRSDGSNGTFRMIGDDVVFDTMDFRVGVDPDGYFNSGTGSIEFEADAEGVTTVFVAGQMILNNATLDVDLTSLAGTFISGGTYPLSGLPVTPYECVLFDNQMAVSGTFNELADGDAVGVGGGKTGTISYTGGADNRDIVVTVGSPDEPIVSDYASGLEAIDAFSSGMNSIASPVQADAPTQLSFIQFTGTSDFDPGSGVFEIRIYESDNGLPTGTPVFTTGIVDTFSLVDRRDTGLVVEGRPLFEYTAAIGFPMKANTEYWISVFGIAPGFSFGLGLETGTGLSAVSGDGATWQSSTDNFNIRVFGDTVLPPNDDLVDAIPIVEYPIDLTGFNIGATTEMDELDVNSVGQSVWYSFTSPVDGTVLINTVGSNFDTQLHVYTDSGTGFSGLELVANNDDFIGGPNNTSQVGVLLSSGQSYMIRVGGWQSSEGCIVLKSFAVELPDVVGTFAPVGFGFNESDTQMLNDDEPYFYQVIYDGVSELTLDTLASPNDIDTEIALFDEDGVLLGDNNQFGGNQSRLTFDDLEAGTYYLVITGSETDFGDAFQVIPASPFTPGPVVTTVSTQEAPFVPGDVNCDGVVNLLDIEPFVELLSGGGYDPKADINGDGVLNLLDIEPFVDLLSG